MNIDYSHDSRGIDDIVRDGLCHKCGACVGICPSRALTVGPEGYPVANDSCTQCGMCVTACSGIDADFGLLGKTVLGDGYEWGADLGGIRTCWVACAADRVIRDNGASGGVVTQLLVHLIDSGRIQGALVAAQDPVDPARCRGMIAATRAELIDAAQSRYTATTGLSALADLASETAGRYAVVGLPCQIHAMRKILAMKPGMADRCALLIGLYCHFNLPVRATRDVIAIARSGRASPASVRYRAKDKQGWPSNTWEIRHADGSVWRSPLTGSETMTVLGRLYPLGRCLTCPDLTAEFADISVGDPWIRASTGEWKYPGPDGWSAVLIRTERGESIWNDAVGAGAVRCEPALPSEIAFGQRTVLKEKKRHVPCRIRLRELMGLPVPRYHVPMPPAGLGIIVAELLFGASRILTLLGPARRLLIRIALSPFGRGIFEIRRAKKRKKAAIRHGGS